MSALQSVGGSPPAAAPSRRPDPMSAVTELLGGDRQEISAQLRSGKSLDDVAKARGVGHDELMAAIRQGLPEQIDDRDAAGASERIAGSRSGSGRGATPRQSDLRQSDLRQSGARPTGARLTAPQRDRLQRLSALLDTPPSALLDQLLSGTSLSALARQKGLTASEVSQALHSQALHKGDLLDTTA